MHHSAVMLQYLTFRHGQDTVQNLDLQYIPSIPVFYLLPLAFHNTEIPETPTIMHNFMFRKTSTRYLDKCYQKISASSNNENVLQSCSQFCFPDISWEFHILQ